MEKLTAWLAAMHRHKRGTAAHGSAAAKTEYAGGQAKKIHLTDTLTIEPGTPVRAACEKLSEIIRAIAEQYAAAPPGAFEVRLRVSGRDGKVTAAEAVNTLSIDLTQRDAALEPPPARG